MENYRIDIIGKPKNLEKLLKEISQLIDNGSSYEKIKKEVGSLEKITEMKQYIFETRHKIYYNNKQIIYTPTVSNQDIKKFHYNFFRDILYQAIINTLEEKNKD